MVENFKDWALRRGEKLQVIPVERLQDVKAELEVFSKTEELNGFQKWIISDMYNFTVPEAGFTISSIIIMAIPHPFYANVEFTRRARNTIFKPGHV